MSLWPRIINILISNWPRTRKFSQLFKITGGEDLSLLWSRVGHALRPILCSDCSRFDRWVQAQNFCSILKLVYFGRWSWQSFVSTCDVFNRLFPLDVMKYSSYQESSVIHGWFVYWVFGWEMRRLSKSEIRFRLASFSLFTLLDTGLKVSSDSGLNTVAFRNCISNSKPEEILYLMFVFLYI